MWKTLPLVLSTFGLFASVPLEHFFSHPEVRNVRISPDGGHIAYTQLTNHRMNLFVKDLETATTTQLTFSLQHNIWGIAWATNEKILFRQDQDGDENFHLYCISIKNKEITDLTPFEKIRATIIHNDLSGKLLIQMNVRKRQFSDVYQLDLISNSIQMVEKNPKDVIKWITDHNGKLRLAIFRNGLIYGIRYRKTEEDSWKTIAQYTDTESAIPLMFTFDNQSIYVASNLGRDRRAIFTFDLDTGKEQECIFEHFVYDIDAYYQPMIFSKKKNKLLAVKYLTDTFVYHSFDENFQKILTFLDHQLPGYEFLFISNDESEKKFIIHAGSALTAGSYYLLDIQNGKFLKLWDFALKDFEMSKTKPITYHARDGLPIHGYFTLPKEGKEPYPLIVYPHGGPWSRDQLEYNPVVQFLANRGYAVLQMNYRGSMGYGKKFLEASYKQWGLAMQDDITDGVFWALDQKIIDPKKIAIFGMSYGGYAALMGIVKTPDLYTAAIDYVGISNLFTYFDTLPDFWESERTFLYKTIGHPIHDQEKLKATSPVFHVDKIKAPLFIAHGSHDPRVKKEHSDQMVEALQTRGKIVQYFVKDNEGHGFLKDENNLELYQAIELFLEKHLGSEKKI